MKVRCYNPKQNGYKDYGGRGITVCNRWLNGDGAKSGFECFVADLGERPSLDLSLDRINTNGNYEPLNCRWTTAKEQMRNMSRNRICEYKGHKGPVVEIAEMFSKVGQKTVYERLRRGWPIDKAVDLPRLPRGQALKRLG